MSYGGVFIIGVLVGVFITIMFAVLSVERQQEEQEKEQRRRIAELDEQIRQEKEKLRGR